jgi:hypothetical protein
MNAVVVVIGVENPAVGRLENVLKRRRERERNPGDFEMVVIIIIIII